MKRVPMNKVNFVNAEKYFDEIRKYENVVLFGCGGKGKQAISILEKRNIKITAACDNNVDLFGKKFMEGVYIENFERVRQNLQQGKRKLYMDLIFCRMRNQEEFIVTQFIGN